MINAKKLYETHYEHYRKCFIDERSKYAWAASDIFDLVTYDEYLDEVFVKDILEVCQVILDGETFEYIKDEQNYTKYILVCQLLDKFHWIDWGSSIRGAWFEESHGPLDESRKIVSGHGWWKHGKGKPVYHNIDAVPFTVANLKTLIEFMTEETDDMVDGIESVGEETEFAEE